MTVYPTLGIEETYRNISSYRRDLLRESLEKATEGTSEEDRKLIDESLRRALGIERS